MENKALFLTVDVIGENSFHDTVLEKLNENNKETIYSIKENLLNQFLDNVEEKEEKDFVTVELNSAQTKSGNVELLEFYIEEVDLKVKENSIVKKFKVSI